jgi:hypothetical protein
MMLQSKQQSSLGRSESHLPRCPGPEPGGLRSTVTRAAGRALAGAALWGGASIAPQQPYAAAAAEPIQVFVVTSSSPRLLFHLHRSALGVRAASRACIPFLRSQPATAVAFQPRMKAMLGFCTFEYLGCAFEFEWRDELTNRTCNIFGAASIFGALHGRVPASACHERQTGLS